MVEPEAYLWMQAALELAEHAGVSRQLVSQYISLLVDIGIIESVEETSRQ